MSNKSLFSFGDFQLCLKREASRKVSSPEVLNKIDDTILMEWLSLNGDKLFSYPDKVESFLELINGQFGQVAQKTMIDNSVWLDQIVNRINRHLDCSLGILPSDFIVVFGSRNENRINRAIELWKENIAEEIVITGGQPFNQPELDNESDSFLKIALRAGVPREKIIVEDKSLTLMDNVKRVLNLLEDEGRDFERLCLVLPWFAQYRAKLAFKMYSDRDIEIRCADVEVSEKFSREKWSNNIEGVNAVMKELVKLALIKKYKYK